MKNKLILIFFLCLSSAVFAQNYHTSAAHNLAIWTSGEYARFDNYLEQAQVFGGAAIEIGVGYEYNTKPEGLLLQTGIGLSYQTSALTYMPFKEREYMKDTEGIAHIAKFDFRNIHESDTYYTANVDFLMGYKWRNSMYFLGGPKVAFPIVGHGITTSMVTTTARYDGLIGEDGNGLFTDMPNHYLTTNLRTHTQKLAYNPYVGMFLECGYMLWDKKVIQGNIHMDYHTLRIACFCEFGWHINTSNASSDLVVNQAEYPVYQPAAANYLYANNRLGYITSLCCGIKITYLLGNKSRICIHCEL